MRLFSEATSSGAFPSGRDALPRVKDGNRGWQVMDGSNPAAPKNLGSLAAIASVTRVAVWGDYVLVPSN
jgi:hypothetical protein